MNLKRNLGAETSRPGKRVRRPVSPDDASGRLLSTTSAKDREHSAVLDRAANILAVQVAALSNVTALYQSNPDARRALAAAVSTIATSQASGGKLITCAVGKSAHVARKVTATCKSLGIRSSFMHACEAVHGDLGDVGAADVLLFVTFSGRTPELMNLLPHLPDAVSVLAMSGHLDPLDCALLTERAGILLPTPIHETEESCFGVSAPTTSTLVTLAVGDMLALTVAEEMHGDDKGTVFKRHHPGGAIGMKQGIESFANHVELDSDGGLLSPEESAEDNA